MSEIAGWSASPSTVARHRVVRHLGIYQAEHNNYPPCGLVADALDLPVQAVIEVVGRLQADGLASPSPGLVPANMSAALTAEGRSLARDWSHRAESLRGRRQACRDALLDWTDEHPGAPDPGAMLQDNRAYFFGALLTADEVESASGFLLENGLISGATTAESDCVWQARTTVDGQQCLERFGGRVAAWLSRSEPTPTTQVTIRDSHSINVASNSPGAQQTIAMSQDARAQVLQSIDAFEQTLTVLGLDHAAEASAREVIAEVREEVDRPAPDAGRLDRAMDRVKQLAVSGTNTAVGAAIVLLVEAAAGKI